MKSYPARLLLIALTFALAPSALAKTTWYVDGVNGNDNNDCLTTQTACQTIGHAISLCSSGDTIMVAPATYYENLTITISLKIIGSDAKTTIVDGNHAGSVVTISDPQVSVRLSNLTIQNGYGDEYGGGIWNGGTLTIDRSKISSNFSSYSGGGISNFGTLMIYRSTLSGNRAHGSGPGGGIWNGGTLTIDNSTITGNFAWEGGGIYNYLSTATIDNSTFSENHGHSAGNIFANGWGFAIQNTIVANSSHGANCRGNLISNGYNLSSDNSCNLTGPGDMNNVDPMLGKLKYNGGPTPTIQLLPGSPAIDAGNPDGCTDNKGKLLKTDQRGKPRPDKQSGHCDIGAFERQKK